MTSASRNGHDKVVDILLQRVANINTQGGEYGNGFYAACSRGYPITVQIQLQHGADPVPFALFSKSLKVINVSRIYGLVKYKFNL